MINRIVGLKYELIKEYSKMKSSGMNLIWNLENTVCLASLRNWVLNDKDYFSSSSGRRNEFLFSNGKFVPDPTFCYINNMIHLIYSRLCNLGDYLDGFPAKSENSWG